MNKKGLSLIELAMTATLVTIVIAMVWSAESFFRRAVIDDSASNLSLEFGSAIHGGEFVYQRMKHSGTFDVVGQNVVFIGGGKKLEYMPALQTLYYDNGLGNEVVLENVTNLVFETTPDTPRRLIANITTQRSDGTFDFTRTVVCPRNNPSPPNIIN